MQFSLKLIRTSLLTFLALFSFASLAQDNTAAQASMAAQPAVTQISDTDLKKFVKANNEIAKVREHYIAKLNEADDQESAQALQAEVQQKMIAVVNEVGIDAQLYNEIINQLQNDESLRQRLEKMQ